MSHGLTFLKIELLQLTLRLLGTETIFQSKMNYFVVGKYILGIKGLSFLTSKGSTLIVDF